MPGRSPVGRVITKDADPREFALLASKFWRDRAFVLQTDKKETARKRRFLAVSAGQFAVMKACTFKLSLQRGF